MFDPISISIGIGIAITAAGGVAGITLKIQEKIQELESAKATAITNEVKVKQLEIVVTGLQADIKQEKLKFSLAKDKVEAEQVKAKSQQVEIEALAEKIKSEEIKTAELLKKDSSLCNEVELLKKRISEVLDEFEELEQHNAELIILHASLEEVVKGMPQRQLTIDAMRQIVSAVVNEKMELLRNSVREEFKNEIHGPKQKVRSIMTVFQQKSANKSTSSIASNVLEKRS